MNDITPKSSKEDIITAAIELTDSQAERIQELEEQQLILFIFAGVLTTFSLF